MSSTMIRQCPKPLKEVRVGRFFGKLLEVIEKLFVVTLIHAKDLTVTEVIDESISLSDEDLQRVAIINLATQFHAVQHYPKAITPILWPHALKHVTNIQNSLPRHIKAKRPISTFSHNDFEPKLKQFYPFGCSIYVLQETLQHNNPFPNWDERFRVAIFLCHNLHHASSITLFLNTQTVIVSPQFDCIYYETLTQLPVHHASSITLFLNTQTVIVSLQFYCIYYENFDTIAREQHFESLWWQKFQLTDEFNSSTTDPSNKQSNILHHENSTFPDRILQIIYQVVLVFSRNPRKHTIQPSKVWLMCMSAPI